MCSVCLELAEESVVTLCSSIWGAPICTLLLLFWTELGYFCVLALSRGQRRRWSVQWRSICMWSSGISGDLYWSCPHNYLIMWDTTNPSTLLILLKNRLANFLQISLSFYHFFFSDPVVVVSLWKLIVMFLMILEMGS